MTSKTYNYSLLQGFVKFFRLPWSMLTLVVAVILLLFLILVAYLKGYFSNGIDWSFWRLGLQSAIIVYILIIYPFIQRLWERALQNLRLLVPQPELLNKIATYNRRWECMSLFLGAVFAIALSQPWGWIEEWTDLYSFITGIIMFSLLGYLIYGGLAGTIRLAQLNRKYLRLDIFDTGLLVPVARWSLSVSLAFVGGISLSILFQPLKNLQSVYSIIIYSILVCVTILLFFTSMWSTHSAMTSAKRRELAMVRKKLDDARQELKQHINGSTVDGMDRLYPAIAVWGMYERQVLDAPTWPFNAGILGRLIASAIAPAIIYIIKIFSGLRFG
jgi:ABC-type multidrug transport system fused ATPase/permease subunit